MLTKLQNTKRSQNPSGKNLLDENNKKWGNPNRKMDKNNKNNNNNNESIAWKGRVGLKNPRKVDSKLAKSRKPTEDNPCSKKGRQEKKKGKGEKMDCFGKFKQRRKWSCGDPKLWMFQWKNMRERGGEIVRVTHAQASTKTKIRGELFN